MGLFTKTKTSGEGWSFDKSSGRLTISGELPDDEKFEFEILKKKVRSIVALEGAKIKSGFGLFSYMSNLVSADLSKLDVSECDSMTWMFQGCSALRELDASTWDTTNVRAMNGMFEHCWQLEQIKTGIGWDLSNLEDCAGMFYSCKKLSGFRVWSWPHMMMEKCNMMFSHCMAIEELDLSAMDIYGVEDLSFMFSGCSNLRYLTLAGWYTSGISDMRELFYGCKNLEVLDLTGWHIDEGTNTEDMFNGLPKTVRVLANDETVLRRLPEGIKVEQAGWHLEGDTLVIDGELPSWNDEYRGDAYRPDLAPWNEYDFIIRKVVAKPGAKAKTCLAMFSDFLELEEVDLHDLDISEVSDMSYMFQNCTSLKSIDLSGMDVSSVQKFVRFFKGSDSLTSIRLNGWKVNSGAHTEEFFQDCEELEEVYCEDPIIRKEALLVHNAAESPDDPSLITRNAEATFYQELFGIPDE